MKYVMSDLHGRYDKFLKMLDIINFSDNDELYILGDIFDRGKQSIEILEYIRASKNIFLIKGNHEDMFEKYYEDNSNLNLWLHNGGLPTYMSLKEKGQGYIDDVYQYIKKLPFILKVDNYILAHAGLYLPENYKDLSIEEILNIQTEEYLLWDREFLKSKDSIYGYDVILGHTPTITISKDAQIIYKNGKYLIDCGAVFEKHEGKLACFCLNNKKEFYV